MLSVVKEEDARIVDQYIGFAKLVACGIEDRLPAVLLCDILGYESCLVPAYGV